MSSDPNKKTARTFQCRDILWDAFQTMAQELECSVDYLINESMKQYARHRYAGRTAARSAEGTPAPASDPVSETSVPRIGGPPLPGAPTLRPSAVLPLPPPPAARPRAPANLPPPPMPRGAPSLRAPGASTGPAAPAVQPAAGTARSIPPPLPAPRSQPAAPLSGRYPGSGAPASPTPYSGQLSVRYAGEQLAVTKDRFIIGRGKQSSDLTIKDPNVSRQHAMVEFLNGQYYMVDMGSTNGVEWNGQRISRRPIAEGDVYRICDHEVSFTYR